MGKRSKGGRKKQPGERYKNGRLRPVVDRGNEKVVEMTTRYRPFQDGKADQWVLTSAIGRAWAVGLLDGFGADAAAIRDAGLGYAARYWGEYGCVAGVANYEGESRRGGCSGSGADPRGETFERLDAAIDGAGRPARMAVHELVVDHYWFPHENPAWLDRLINERLIVAGRAVCGELTRGGERERLALAVTGLLTVVQGSARKAA